MAIYFVSTNDKINFDSLISCAKTSNSGESYLTKRARAVMNEWMKKKCNEKKNICVCVCATIYFLLYTYTELMNIILKKLSVERRTHVKRSLTCDTFIVTNNDEKKKRDVLCVPIYVSVLNDYKCKIGRCIFLFFLCLIAQIFEITSHTNGEIYWINMFVYIY